MSTGMKAIIGGFALFVVLAVTGCAGIHWHNVPVGEVGVKVRTLFNAGTDPTPLEQGTHFLTFGEEIHNYPIKQVQYDYTEKPDVRGNEQEQVKFNDSRGLPMSGELVLQASSPKACTPELWNNWKMDIDDLIAGPIRLDVQSAISVETEHTTVENLYSGGRQAVVTAALAVVAKKWAPYCVNITMLNWAGPITYPPEILEAIKAKTATDQATQNAEAQVKLAKANADKMIEEARGIAEKARLEGEALRANPEVLQREWIAAWSKGGALVPNTLITSAAGANQFMMQLPNK